MATTVKSKNSSSACFYLYRIIKHLQEISKLFKKYILVCNVVHNKSNKSTNKNLHISVADVVPFSSLPFQRVVCNYIVFHAIYTLCCTFFLLSFVDDLPQLAVPHLV